MRAMTMGVSALLSLGMVLSGCGDSASGASGEPCFPTTLSAALCDPSQVEFTLESRNPYYPLIPGLRVVMEGFDPEEGVVERVEREVLTETRMVNGVEVHILKHDAYHDGEIHEVAYNFYVETTAGTVCYFGEDVEFYAGGNLVGMEGSWRAGVGGALPGIIMPADPKVGDAYFQEQSDGEALDMGHVTAVGQTGTINGERYENMVTILDSDPLDTCDEQEPKQYIPNIGEVIDVHLEMIDYTPAP